MNHETSPIVWDLPERQRQDQENASIMLKKVTLGIIPPPKEIVAYQKLMYLCQSNPADSSESV